MAKRRKVISPCTCLCGYPEKNRDAFCEIIFEDGRLSICGVVGPRNNGDCWGGAGQCVDEIRKGEPNEANGWTREMLDKLCNIWDTWHLNDARAYCHHMKELGWDEECREQVMVKKWELKHEYYDKARDAKNRAISCLKNGEVFEPTPEETLYANLSGQVTTYNGEEPEMPEYYEYKEKDCLGRSNTEYKMRGWIRNTEHELGILCKPCPVCGYKYGTAWIKEDVPEEVIEWLFSLPDAYKTPAWV